MILLAKTGGDYLRITAKRIEDGEYIIISNVRQINRLRTDLQRANQRAGWFIEESEGTSLLFDDTFQIISCSDDTKQ